MRSVFFVAALAAMGVNLTSADCPIGTTPPPFEVSLSWDMDGDLDLYVIEPGGMQVYHGNRLGDVGMLGGDVTSGPGVETFVLLNGLDADAEGGPLGNYQVWAGRHRGADGIQWTLTARSNDLQIWQYTGEFSDGVDITNMYEATVQTYGDFDCYNEDFGKCPRDSYSETGFPPCLQCPSGEISESGATFCTNEALQDFDDLPQNIADAILADATGGFAGPGYLTFDEPVSGDNVNNLEEDDAGTLHLAGKFQRSDDAVLPASTALFLYLDDGNADTDFVRGQGYVNYNTGDFIATITDVPNGYIRVLLSFVVIDPADTPAETGPDTIFSLFVVNNGCSRPLTITLEWNTDNSDLDLHVVEPGGNTVYYDNRVGDVGFLDNDNTVGFGPENYIVYSGLNVAEDAVLGEYTARVYRASISTDTIWTLTARINGEVAWIEEGRFFDNEFSYSFSYDYSDFEGSSSTSDYRSGIFSVSLNEYDSGDCTLPHADEATVPPTPAAVNLMSTGGKKDPSPLT